MQTLPLLEGREVASDEPSAQGKIVQSSWGKNKGGDKAMAKYYRKRDKAGRCKFDILVPIGMSGSNMAKERKKKKISSFY